MEKHGFIITRHVNSEKTNEYWNHSIRLLRRLYVNPRIVIIDDNSNYDFISTDQSLVNITVIQSEFPGRGELLPFYYLLKYRFFEYALILHDSVFLHHKINLDKLDGVKVLPLWIFNSDTENIQNTKRILRGLQNMHILEPALSKEKMVLSMPQNKWFGCFGVQCYIHLPFLEHIERKYRISKLVEVVHNRKDRCCLERIFGCIFFTECKDLQLTKSILGDIMQYQRWGYSFDEYMKDLHEKKIRKYIIKVWTGR